METSEVAARTIAVGVIGAGRIGSLHTRNLVAHQRVGDVMIFDEDGDKARGLADLAGAGVAVTADKLMSKVEAVIVATPSVTHPEFIEAGVARGLSVFCEKPVAIDLATACRVAGYVNRLGGHVQIGFQRRADPEYRILRQRVLQGTIGRITLVRVVTFDRRPPTGEYLANAGDIFVDCLVHDLDAVQWLSGQQIVEVSAWGTRAGAPDLDYDFVTVSGFLSDGGQVSLSVGRRHPLGYDHRLEMVGALDAVALGTDHAPLRRASSGSDPGGVCSGFQDRFKEAYVCEIDLFVRSCVDALHNPCTIDDALMAMRVVEAVRESVATGGRPVRVLAESAVGQEYT